MADGKVIIDVELNEGKAVRGVDNVNRRLSAIVSSGHRAAASIRNMVTALGLTAAAAKAINMVSNALDGAISRYDTLKGFPAVMEQIGFSTEESRKAIQRLSDGVQGLPTALDSVAKTAQRIAVMTGDLDGAVETTLALNNAFIASGASVADAERGLEQYIQMLAKGEVDLQSWRTLQETMGMALNDVAKAFGFAGRSAQMDLYEALKSGKITFEEFNQKLIELSNQTGGFADRARTAAGGIRTAWTNMNTAVVRGVTNILEAIDEVLADTPLQSIENVIKNIGDAFFNALDWVANGIKNLKGEVGEINSIMDLLEGAFQVFYDNFPSIMENIINKIAEFFPRWYEMAAQNGLRFLEGLTSVVPQLLEAVQQIIQQILMVILERLPSFVESGSQLLITLIEGIISMLPQLIEMGNQLITTFIETVISLLPLLLDTGIDVLIALVDGVINALPSLVDAGVQIISTTVGTILENLPKIIEAGIDLLNALVDGIIDSLPTLLQAAIELIVKLAAEIIKNLPKIIQAGIEIILALIDGLIKTIPTLVGSIPKIVDAIFKAFAKVDWKKIGKDIIQGLINGISSLKDRALQKAQEIADGIKSRIKSALGIHSPSRVMMELGKDTGQGFVLGLESAIRNIQRVSDKLATASIPQQGSGSLVSTSNDRVNNITVYNYGQDLSAQSVIDALRRKEWLG